MLHTHCPFCTNRLILATEAIEWDDAAVITRQCPACNRTDAAAAGTQSDRTRTLPAGCPR